MLKHHGAIDARPGDFLAVDLDGAFFIRQQARDDVEQCGFAAAAGAHDGGRTRRRPPKQKRPPAPALHACRVPANTASRQIARLRSFNTVTS